MMIRDYTDTDLPRLKEIHSKQGVDYPFPSLDNPLYRVKLVGGNGDNIEQAILVRVTSECYLMMDRKEGEPKERNGLFLALHQAACQRAWSDGFADGHIWLPPDIDKSFGRRLMRLGWTKPLWPCYTKVLEAI